MNLGFFILTKNPHKSQINFIENLRIFYSEIHSYIVVDDNKDFPDKLKSFILQVDDDLC